MTIMIKNSTAGSESHPPHPLLTQVKATLTDGKAEAMVVLNTEQQSRGLFAYMVVVTANTARHAAALTARIKSDLKAMGHKNITIESSALSEWTLIDCGDLVVHIMLPASRDYYQLESLWSMRPMSESEEESAAASSGSEETND